MALAESQIMQPTKFEISPHFDKMFDADLAAKQGESFRWMMSLEDCQWVHENGMTSEE